MSLPANLIEEIRKVGAAQEVDVDEAIRSVSALVGADECVSYRIWGGPGFGQEEVLLDVYVLSKHALYCHTVYKTRSQSSCQFLDAIASVLVTAVSHPRSSYILAVFVGSEVEASRMFGGPGDLHSLEVFQGQIISERLRNRENRHASLSN